MYKLHLHIIFAHMKTIQYEELELKCNYFPRESSTHNTHGSNESYEVFEIFYKDKNVTHLYTKRVLHLLNEKFDNDYENLSEEELYAIGLNKTIYEIEEDLNYTDYYI